MAGTRFDVHLLRVFLVRAKDTNRTSTDFCSNDTVTRSRATDFCARARMNVLSVFGVKRLSAGEKKRKKLPRIDNDAKVRGR